MKKYAAFVTAFCLAGSGIQGATYLWSSNTTVQGGSGTWDTATGHWGTAAPFNLVWNNANLDTASFTSTYSGGWFPYTVTLGANVSAAKLDHQDNNAAKDITINPDAGGLYKITLQPASGGTSIFGNSRSKLIINAPVVLAINQAFQYNVTVNGVISEDVPGRTLRVTPFSNGAGAPNTITLGGNNTFSGGLTYNLGFAGDRLALGHDNALGSGPFTWATGGTLEAVNGDRTISNKVAENWNQKRIVAGANDFTFTGSYQVQSYADGGSTADDFASLDVQDANGIVTFQNFKTLTSTGFQDFKKLGAGTMVLNTLFTKSGSTALPFTVDAGKLLVNTPATMGNVTVASGATLGGTGTINLDASKTCTVQAGGKVAPGGIAAGAEVGTLTVNGPLVFQENAIYHWQHNGSAGDRLQVNGAVTLPTVATVTVTRVGGTLPREEILFTATSRSGASDLSGWVITGDAAPGAAAELSGNNVILTGLTPPSGTVVTLR